MWYCTIDNERTIILKLLCNHQSRSTTLAFVINNCVPNIIDTECNYASMYRILRRVGSSTYQVPTNHRMTSVASKLLQCVYVLLWSNNVSKRGRFIRLFLSLCMVFNVSVANFFWLKSGPSRTLWTGEIYLRKSIFTKTSIKKIFSIHIHSLPKKIVTH